MMAASEETSCIPLHCAKAEKKSEPGETSPSQSPSQAMSVTLESECRELWNQFDSVGTEMIVTRRGRRMFPALKMELHNLNPNSFYVLLMDLVPVDKHRYKYQNSKWVKCFEEACSHTRLYVHPESPALGSYWMDHVVSFYKLKLTNNQLDSQGHIIVHSMHKYQPRLHIVESNDTKNLNWDNFHSFTFPGTQFTTVTAYQNDKITQLKIDNNPFAKGFRHPMPRHRMKPVRYPVPSGSSESGAEEGMTIVGTKRPSSGSEEDASSAPKYARFPSPVVPRDDGGISVTTHVNPAVETVTSSNSTYKPLYIVYDHPQKASLTTMSNHQYVAAKPQQPSPPPLQKDITMTTSTTMNSFTSSPFTSSPFTLVRVPSGSTKLPTFPPKPVSPKQYLASPTTSKKIMQEDNISIASEISSSNSDAEIESTQSPVQMSPPLVGAFQLSPKHGSLPTIYNAPSTLASSVAQPTVILTTPHPPTVSLSPKSSPAPPTIVARVPQQSIIIQTPNIISNPGQPILFPMGPVPAGKVTGQNIIIPYSIVGSSPNGHVIQTDQQQQPIFQMIPSLPMLGTNGHCPSQGVQLIALNTQSSS